MGLAALWRGYRDRRLTRLGCVFIVGAGRSGTHFLAQSLATSPRLQVLMERPPLFGWSTTMAIDPRAEETLFPQWVRLFREEQARVAPRVVVDKTHPNIWITDRLAAAFPRGSFLGLRRRPHATIASMLLHGRFVYPESRWRPLPVPNRFLGIERDKAEEYAALSPVEQLTLRWVANERRFAVIRQSLGKRLLEVEYEQLVLNAGPAFERISAFLRLDHAISPPALKPGVLEKWRDELTPQQIAAIDAMLSRLGFEADRSGP